MPKLKHSTTSYVCDQQPPPYNNGVAAKVKPTIMAESHCAKFSTRAAVKMNPWGPLSGSRGPQHAQNIHLNVTNGVKLACVRWVSATAVPGKGTVCLRFNQDFAPLPQNMHKHSNWVQLTSGQPAGQTASCNGLFEHKHLFACKFEVTADISCELHCKACKQCCYPIHIYQACTRNL